jgi:hypothetical protein
MNDYEQELIDELLEAEEMFDIDPRAIQEFRRENRTQGKKKKKVKVEDKE